MIFLSFAYDVFILMQFEKKLFKAIEFSELALAFSFWLCFFLCLFVARQ